MAFQYRAFNEQVPLGRSISYISLMKDALAPSDHYDYHGLLIIIYQQLATRQDMYEKAPTDPDSRYSHSFLAGGYFICATCTALAIFSL
ncbi:hypothetical protein F5146DRAFT_1145012 [Armillaria mellea]|nr:hypothetical protein F5146DRAFT_1145012 [Armillaria mellea]